MGTQRHTWPECSRMASANALSLSAPRSLPGPHWPGLEGCCSPSSHLARVDTGSHTELSTQTGSGGQTGRSPSRLSHGPPQSSTVQRGCQEPVHMGPTPLLSVLVRSGSWLCRGTAASAICPPLPTAARPSPSRARERPQTEVQDSICPNYSRSQVTRQLLSGLTGKGRELSAGCGVRGGRPISARSRGGSQGGKQSADTGRQSPKDTL